MDAQPFKLAKAPKDLQC